MDHEVDYDADDEYDFKLAREYTWNIKSKISSGYEENYYFIMKEDGVYYNELETRCYMCFLFLMFIYIILKLPNKKSSTEQETRQTSKNRKHSAECQIQRVY